MLFDIGTFAEAPAGPDSGLQAFLRSLVVVSAAELFDKTWCIGLLLALQYSTAITTVFVGSFSALLLHTVLAAGFGCAVARFIAPQWLDFTAAGLMLVFAILSFWEWYASDPECDAFTAGCGIDREEALGPPDTETAEGTGSAGVQDRSSCAGAALLQASQKSAYGATEAARVTKQSAREPCAILTEAFCAIFVAEWGDRTQFAMVGQHASQPLLPTFLGCSVAFFLATVSAVIMGSMLASYGIKARLVHAVTAIAFLFFSILTFRDGIAAASASTSTGAPLADLKRTAS